MMHMLVLDVFLGHLSEDLKIRLERERERTVTLLWLLAP
jgi:hypothetical protein